MFTNGITFTFPNLKRTVEYGLGRVEEELLEQVRGHGNLIDPLTGHLAKAGGKRLRPMLTLLASQLGREKEEVTDQAVKCALAVELIHLATLYHDDVMDCAPIRRGAVAAHEQWSNNLAILAGDLLFARASQIISRLPASMIMRYAVTFERLCAGQMSETFGPEQGVDALEHYLKVLSDKTGSLVATSLCFGAESANLNPEILEALEKYGEKIGVAYQLVDDVIDLCSDSDTSGKTPGTDLLEGVDTMPILLLRQQLTKGELDSDGQKLLADIDSDLSDKDRLQSVIQRLRQNKVVDQTMKIATDYKNEALEAIDILPKGEVRKALEAFAKYSVNREK
ncbi:polyprenyl synthetase family protein [Actinomyces sp. zg-332]|uniref:polyprenyl synthetase family protein n=1 Tax=Actinomyces sp. zg-332 TaxID=2708340 RepID=UPI00141E030A|nr:polyprenyl synthetase family protein [Actinomyces sp. zg-332]QPK94010.1 polyprenyl synthetase family protein [Actinomyces sp. zg-332]